MNKEKCTCGVVTQGDLGWVTGSEKCPVHSRIAIKKLLNEYLRELPLPKKVLDKLKTLQKKEETK